MAKPEVRVHLPERVLFNNSTITHFFVEINKRATGMRVVCWLWEDAFRETGMLRALAEAGVKSLY